jgi:hypothetical protein
MPEGLIYRLWSGDLNYIGSTENTLDYRLIRHEFDYGKWVSGGFRTGYLSSFEILKESDYFIEEIDRLYFENKKDLIKLEKFYINSCNCVNIQYNLSRPRVREKRKPRYDRHSVLDLRYFVSVYNTYRKERSFISDLPLVEEKVLTIPNSDPVEYSWSKYII